MSTPEQDALLASLALCEEALTDAAEVLAELNRTEGLTLDQSGVLEGLEAQRLDLYQRRERQAQADYQAQAAAKCPDCKRGLEAKILDTDGVLASISGEPGTWQHGVEEYYWPCTAAAIHQAEAERRIAAPAFQPVAGGEVWTLKRAHRQPAARVQADGWYWLRQLPTRGRLAEEPAVVLAFVWRHATLGYMADVRNIDGTIQTWGLLLYFESAYGPLDAPNL